MIRRVWTLHILGLIQLLQGVGLFVAANNFKFNPLAISNVQSSSFAVALILGGLFLLTRRQDDPSIILRLGSMFPVMNWLFLAQLDMLSDGGAQAIVYFILSAYTVVLSFFPYTPKCEDCPHVGGEKECQMSR